MLFSDPDITLNDGVYSRYFTNFTDAGEYTVTVSVSNTGFVTKYGTNENAGIYIFVLKTTNKNMIFAVCHTSVSRIFLGQMLSNYFYPCLVSSFEKWKLDRFFIFCSRNFKVISLF